MTPSIDYSALKGIDIDSGLNVLATTAERDPLRFFDLAVMLKHELLQDPAGIEAARRGNLATDLSAH